MHEVASRVALPPADTWGMHGDVGTGWWVVTETPMAVLQRRFAEGVTSAEDSEQRRELLADAVATAPGAPVGESDASLAGSGESPSVAGRPASGRAGAYA